jgi:hypothetical protein
MLHFCLPMEIAHVNTSQTHFINLYYYGQVFKKQRRAYTKMHSAEQKAGDKKLLEITLTVTRTIEDPFMGTVLALKW